MPTSYFPPRGEAILPLPVPTRPVVNVRSTFLSGSLAGMKASGHYDVYLRALPQEHHEVVLSAIPGVWLPLAVAKAHYRACESVGLPPGEVTKRGRVALERLGGVVYGTALQMARQVGTTPWTLLPGLQRFWDRAYDGGGIAVYKLGPKDARIDLVDCGLCEIGYYRLALAGIVEGFVSLFSGSVYVHEGRPPAGAESASYRAQWA